MSLWFSASAVAPQLQEAYALSQTQVTWLTLCVQLGFVAGAMASAVWNLADRLSPHRLIALSALAGAICNGAIALGAPPFALILIMRFLTGACLAGVYPPGMKLLATWFVRGRGLAIGILIAALTIGSAGPHLLDGLAMRGAAGLDVPWRTTMLIVSGLALLGAGIVSVAVRPGPHLGRATEFHWRHAGVIVTDQPVRLANFGYLAHMWELYAMWTWAPKLLRDSYGPAHLPAARFAGFSVIAIGALGCIVAGFLADRFGRTLLAALSLLISGSCALVAGSLVSMPTALTIVCLVWGLAVVADSAQFSAAVSELCDSRYVGTALTMQTCSGFLLTAVSIHILPWVVDALGWGWATALLALGPVLGIWSMIALRRTSRAVRMAGGRK